jgi:hypothetical protein
MDCSPACHVPGTQPRSRCKLLPTISTRTPDPWSFSISCTCQAHEMHLWATAGWQGGCCMAGAASEDSLHGMPTGHTPQGTGSASHPKLFVDPSGVQRHWKAQPSTLAGAPAAAARLSCPA